MFARAVCHCWCSSVLQRAASRSRRPPTLARNSKKEYRVMAISSPTIKITRKRVPPTTRSDETRRRMIQDEGPKNTGGTPLGANARWPGKVLSTEGARGHQSGSGLQALTYYGGDPKRRRRERRKAW